MKKLNNSNFELVQDIIKSIDFNYEPQDEDIKQQFFSSWNEIIGNKISKFSKLYEISADNVLTVLCADSYIASELYFEKDNILKLVKEKADELGIKIKDIKFNYKKWKE